MQSFEGDPKQLSPLVLAYVGDAVFELYIRTQLAAQRGRIHELHKAAVHYVQAKSQAEIVHQWEPLLTEEEKVIVQRGRNPLHSAPECGGSRLQVQYGVRGAPWIPVSLPPGRAPVGTSFPFTCRSEG